MRIDARFELLHRQRVPAVRRVREVLRAAILAGHHVDGRLPGESALTAQFGVSRGVVRDALALLRSEGLIERLQGAGTFVVTRLRSARAIDALNTRLEASDDARMYRDRMSAEEVPAPPYVADRLGIAVGDTVVHHERLNLIDGIPVTLRSGWMRAATGKRLADHPDELQRQVIDAIETVLGFPIESAELKVEAVVADAATAGPLQVELGAPLLLIERLFRDADGEAVELSFSHIRADRLFLSTVLRRVPGAHWRWADAESQQRRRSS